MPKFSDPDEARKYLSGLSAHKNRPGDTSSLNPAFAIGMANAISDARAAGIPATFMSGYREGNVTKSAYDMSGKSSHGYGLATDVGGIGTAGSKTAKQWNAIAQANGLHNPYLGTKAEGKEWNHWQLPELPLEQMPDQLARLRAAKASGDINQVWAASQPFMAGSTQVASAGATPVGVKINAPTTPIAGGLARPSGGGFLSSVANIESNDSNIPSGIDKDYPGQPGSKSQGHWQIDTPTWLQFAAKAGIDTNRFPNAMSAPRDVQEQVARLIPLSRFGGRTVRMLNEQYKTTLDKNLTLGALDAKYGGGAAVEAPGIVDPSAVARGSTVNPAIPGTAAAAPAEAAPAADQPWWQTAFGKVVAKPTDAEGKPTGEKSPYGKISEAFNKGPARMKALEEDQAPEQVKNYTGTPPAARNVSPGLQNVQQTYGQTLNSFAAPLTWNNAPIRGPQMPAAGSQAVASGGVPGMSLNSVQPLPQGLGYGINSVGYGFG